MTGVLTAGGSWAQIEAQREDDVCSPGDDSHPHAKNRGLRRNSPVHTSTWDFQKVPVVKSLCLWCFESPAQQKRS